MDLNGDTPTDNATIPNGLTNNTDYFIRFVNDDCNQVSTSKTEAQNSDDVTRTKVNIALDSSSYNPGQDFIKDTSYNEALFGNYRTDEVCPVTHRKKTR